MQTGGKNFFELTVGEFLTLELVLTMLISNGLNSNQLNILGNFLCDLGQNVLTIQAIVGASPSNPVYCISADPSSCQSLDTDARSSKQITQEIMCLKEEINQLKAQLAAL